MNHSPPESTLPTTQPSVRELRQTDEGRWGRFVENHPDGNLYHTLAWRDVVQEVFKHRSIYLVCERDGEISGVLPLFHVSFPFLGSKLISMPYDIGSGGALADDDDSERLLIERAVSLAIKMRVGHMELRYRRERSALGGMGFHRSEPVLISEIELDDEARVWKRIDRGHRESIGKAKRRGVTIEAATTLDDFRQFYDVYLRVFHAFGTPPYGANYFPCLWRRLYESRAARLVLAYLDNRCVGGLLLFGSGSSLISKFSVCLPEAKSSRAPAALQWRSIQEGLENGYRWLNLGASAPGQQGIVRFKERWGAMTKPAVVYSLPVRRKVPSLERYFETDDFTRRAWKKLPLRATSLLGGPLNQWFC